MSIKVLVLLSLVAAVSCSPTILSHHALKVVGSHHGALGVKLRTLDFGKKLGILFGGLIGKKHVARNDLSKILDIQVSSFNDVCTLWSKVVVSLADTIDASIKGLGSLLSRLIFSFLKIVICVSGGGDNPICKDSINLLVGVKASPAIGAKAVINLFGLSDCKSRFNIILSIYTRGRGISACRGSVRIIFKITLELIERLQIVINGGSLDRHDVKRIFHGITRLLGVIGNSRKNGLGANIVKGFVPLCNQWVVKAGYPDIGDLGDVNVDISAGNDDRAPWAVSDVDVSANVGLGGLIGGIFKGLIGVTRLASNLIKDILGIVINSVEDVFNLAIKIILGLGGLLDATISGLGSLLVRIVAGLLKIVLCFLGTPGKYGVCSSSWDRQVGVSGSVTSIDAVIQLYGLGNCRSQVDRYISAYTNGKGIDSTSGSVKILLQTTVTLSQIIHTRSWSSSSIVLVFRHITYLLGSVGNSNARGVGTSVCNKFIPACNKYLVSAGFRGLGDSQVDIIKVVEGANDDDHTWSADVDTSDGKTGFIINGSTGGNTGVSVGGGTDLLGGLLKGIFGTITGVVKLVGNALNTILKIKIRAISDVFSLLSNLLLVLQVTLNNLVAGLGSLLVRLVACVLKIAVCILGFPGDSRVCARGWNNQFGVKGEASSAVDLIVLYKLTNAQNELNGYISKCSGGKGIQSTRGSIKIVLESLTTITSFITNYKKITKQTVTDVFIQVTTISGSISNSRKPNSGKDIIENIVKKCGPYFTKSGYPDITGQITIITNKCGQSNGDNVNWNGNGQTNNSGNNGNSDTSGNSGNSSNTDTSGNGDSGNTDTSGNSGNNGNTDTSGNSGNSGHTDTSDNSGNSGHTDTSGNSGNSGNGDSGNTDTSGNSGNNGNTDTSGNSGNSGHTDTSGNSGNSGQTDTSGNSGNSGHTDTSGNSGNSGHTDTSGNSGNNGQTDTGGNSGNSGNTGTSGNSGNSGNTDTSGNSGNNGNTDTSGNSGNNGNTDTSGNSGNSSHTDTSGNSGNNGHTDTSGNTGNSGNTDTSSNSGNNGNTDTSGNSGNSGNTDTSGNSGNSGHTDTSGNSGNNGHTDTSGNTGNSGNTDTSGNSGNNGNTDTSGNSGNSGNTDTSGNSGNSGNTDTNNNNCGQVIGGSIQKIPGVGRLSSKIVTEIISITVNSFSDVITLVSKLTLALGGIIDSIISGLGSILIRIVAVIFKIGYCVNGFGSDKSVCTKDWNAQWGITGEASSTVDLIALYRLNNCKSAVATIVSTYTNGKGISSTSGLVRIILQLVTDLGNVVGSGSITRESFLTVSINIFSIFGSITNSYNAGSGTIIIKKVLPICAPFFVKQGFSDLSKQLSTIVANVNVGTKTKFDWTVVKNGGDSNSDKLVTKVKEVFKGVKSTTNNAPSLTAVLNISPPRNFDDVCSFGVSVVQALAGVVDIFIKGLGTLIVRIVGALINYIVAVLGASRHATSFVSQKAYFKKFGVTVSGSTWADLAAGFKINTCKTDLDVILNTYTKNKGLTSLKGAEKLVFDSAYSLVTIVTKGTSIVEADLTIVFRIVTTLISGFANSLSANIGKNICDNMLPTLSYYLEQDGYPSLGSQSKTIYASIEGCNNVQTPWARSITTTVVNN